MTKTMYTRQELDRDAKSFAKEHAKMICGSPARKVSWSLSIGTISGTALHIVYWTTRKGAAEPECFTTYVAI